jgi:hypothetical protein
MTMRSAGLLVLLSLLPACSDDGQAAEVGGGRGRVEGVAGGTVTLGIKDLNYRPMAVGTAASITGVVALDSTARDSIVPVTRDQDVCGDTARVTETSPANVLVWIDGITSGKPLPEIRRDQIVIDDCRYSPRVLGVIAGTTINVKSRDRLVLTSRFYLEGAPEPVAEVHTVDDGQVVPTEKIAARPGIVEIRTPQHPWIRGYIAVFDHPYFAVADEGGRFTIDSLPPGTYTVKAWHEGLDKPSEQRVVVGPGGTGRVEIMLAGP